MSMRKSATALAIAILFSTAACGSYGAGGGGDFGATPGGVKDMKLARELIASGRVPPPEALLVEGMFAEHDLGLVGAACQDTLCLRAAAGVAPDASGAPHGWLQVGLSSNVDPDLFVRPDTTFIFTVDVSGSMGWGSGSETYPSAGYLARKFLHALADQLGAGDQAAIVTYGSDVSVTLATTSGANQQAIHQAIDRLSTTGSTNMEAGLKKAYELGRQARAAGRGEVRVVLFTDEQPNVGATSPTEFESMAAAGADGGVHLTVMALGLGVGAKLLQSMAQVRGANAFTLQKATDIGAFMDDEYPWFVAPIAYDLSVELAPGAGLDFDRSYGFPTAGDQVPGLTVSTVFLSKRRGALLASLAGDDAALAALSADVDLAWVNPSGVPHQESLHVARDGALDARGQWFAQQAVARSTALALLVSGMHEAAAAYPSSHVDAGRIMTSAADRFAADAAAIGAPDLAPEVDLARAMQQLIADGAPQGSIY